MLCWSLKSCLANRVTMRTLFMVYPWAYVTRRGRCDQRDGKLDDGSFGTWREASSVVEACGRSMHRGCMQRSSECALCQAQKAADNVKGDQ